MDFAWKKVKKKNINTFRPPTATFRSPFPAPVIRFSRRPATGVQPRNNAESTAWVLPDTATSCEGSLCGTTDACGSRREDGGDLQASDNSSGWRTRQPRRARCKRRRRWPPSISRNQDQQVGAPKFYPFIFCSTRVEMLVLLLLHLSLEFIADPEPNQLKIPQEKRPF